ncbi:MAG: hypothetical protein J4F29_13595 [Candidatus Latescibacteria bacterium]|nr:hypothetical protein [Candidatus Latescibacterota bacterium]
MNRVISIFAAWGLAALMVLCVPQTADALGLGVKAGVSLTREQQFDTFYGMGGQFDSHRWMLGSNLDLGSFILPNLHLLPGIDIAVQENLRVYVANLDIVYFFHQTPVGRAYIGGGFGTHFFRPKTASIEPDPAVEGAENQGPQNDTKISVNIPLGYQRKLGPVLSWFGEMKLIIADDEKDSALQFTIGFHFGNE